MRLLGRPVLATVKKAHSDARGPLDAWEAEVESAQGESPQDIRERYRSADFLEKGRGIFNLKGNRYRLVVQVRFQNGLVVVERIGTHAEYSKWRLS
jgi:mRNA interferase HigB